MYIDSFGSFVASFLYDHGSSTQIRLHQFTQAYGINDSAQIVGTAMFDDNSNHGFLYDNGVFHQIDVPGGHRTTVYDINNAGQMVGTFFDDAGLPHSFVFDGAAFMMLDVPGGTSTTATGINDAGFIVGTFSDPTGGSHGFLASPTVPEGG